MTLATTNSAALLSADSRARLLVAGDAPTILELLPGSLPLAGFDAVTAASGGEAKAGSRMAAADRELDQNSMWIPPP
jgi:hypothetical protein